MKKLLYVLVIGGIAATGIVGLTNTTYAITPTLSLYATGNNDSAQVTVNGDSYANVTLYYQRSDYGTQSSYLGTTNSSGYFSTTVNTSNYGISSGSSVYVMVNNQQSSSVTWPYNSYYGGNVTLSQTSVTLTVGQSSTITVSGGTQPYTMFPGTLNIFQPALSGNTLTVTGIAIGTSTLSVCSLGGSGSGCTTLTVYVNTNNNNYYGTLSLSQNSVTLSTGQSMNVTIYGNPNYYNNYYISSHSNSSVSSAYISGSTLTVAGSTYGNDSITVCQSNGGCATLAIYVSYNGNQYQYQGGWIYCSGESQQCNFFGTQTVRYGINGYYYYGTYTNGVSCSNYIFSDPAFGMTKQCWYGGVAQAPSPMNYYPPSTYNSPACNCNNTFTRYLVLGSTGAEVRELQQRLTAEEMYSGPITGYFGKLTRAAVIRYQAAHGLAQTGTVNAATRAALSR